MILQKILLTSLVALQIIGAVGLAVFQTSEAFAQEVSEGSAVIAGLRGVVTVIPGTSVSSGYAPKYRSLLSNGDVIITEEESVAEILIENQALLTVHEFSEATLNKEANGSFTVALQVGLVEWSLSRQSQGDVPLILTTPNIRATSDGGLATVEVQPIFENIARVPKPRKSFLIRTSFQAESTPALDIELLETFCAHEGNLTVEYPGVQQGLREQKTVESGECLGFLNGQLHPMEAGIRLDARRAFICVVKKHCEIPESANKLIVKKLTGQALALERAFVGSDLEYPKAEGQVVLGTTGLSPGTVFLPPLIPPGGGGSMPPK